MAHSPTKFYDRRNGRPAHASSPEKNPRGAVLVVSGHYRHPMTKSPSEYPSHATNVQPATGWAKVLNEVWPAPELARQLRDVDLDKQIPVIARLVFETGEEQHQGVATRWSNGRAKHVRVVINDNRLNSGGVWLDPADVTRV